MHNDNQKAPKERKPKARKFYILNERFGERPADFEVENLAVLRGGQGALAPPKGRRGFPAYPEVPRVVIGKLGRKASPPRDFELFHSYWLVSDPLKRLFEELDPDAFVFLTCDVRLADGSAGPIYWLCDVVRVIEAFDQRTSDELRKHRYRGLLGNTSLVFDDEAIGSARVFCTPHAVNIFADQSVKDACKQAGIRGAMFTPCFKE
ncbi:imm11 family protein [Bradyrhizobium septentrionale]|uniref:DUF1629 domain-containing protein n=1 Tax=Bradyrhizobium septentrionale TaxID=1404411 RepID=A0A973W612_9BRAD|nr:DUF1629 domain-containing protein [Bradyrhizobium septentrionale]UGY16550.1 DUF1629 domain-containing protein [Bradyrhizobium septentrionale]UGY25207.1 DUF1629 domain-containing protein [Bradyrhizobium septentrionale]